MANGIDHSIVVPGFATQSRPHRGENFLLDSHGHHGILCKEDYLGGHQLLVTCGQRATPTALVSLSTVILMVPG